MSNSTLTVNAVANWVRTHIKLAPLFGTSSGVLNEPAMSIANDLVQIFLAAPFDWKFNQVEMAMFVTRQWKQDYLHAGATAFVIQNSVNATGTNWGGVGIELASNNGITESGNTVTVTCLEDHPFLVGQKAYIIGTGSAYDSNYTLSTSGVFSGGWTITAVPTSKTFQFTHPTSGLAASGAPGITDYGWLSSCSRLEIYNTSTPQPQSPQEVVKMILPNSQVGVPTQFCVVKDYGTGVLKVRCYPTPSQEYGVFLNYQAKAPKIVSLTSTFAPIPDELGYVIRQGFLAAAYRFKDEAKYMAEFQRFQGMMTMALSEKDMEQSMNSFSPSEGLFLG